MLLNLERYLRNQSPVSEITIKWSNHENRRTDLQVSVDNQMYQRLPLTYSYTRQEVEDCVRYWPHAVYIRDEGGENEGEGVPITRLVSRHLPREDALAFELLDAQHYLCLTATDRIAPKNHIIYADGTCREILHTTHTTAYRYLAHLPGDNDHLGRPVYRNQALCFKLVANYKPPSTVKRNTYALSPAINKLSTSGSLTHKVQTCIQEHLTHIMTETETETETETKSNPSASARPDIAEIRGVNISAFEDLVSNRVLVEPPIGMFLGHLEYNPEDAAHLCPIDAAKLPNWQAVCAAVNMQDSTLCLPQSSDARTLLVGNQTPAKRTYRLEEVQTVRTEGATPQTVWSRADLELANLASTNTDLSFTEYCYELWGRFTVRRYDSFIRGWTDAPSAHPVDDTVWLPLTLWAPLIARKDNPASHFEEVLNYLPTFIIRKWGWPVEAPDGLMDQKPPAPHPQLDMWGGLYDSKL